MTIGVETGTETGANVGKGTTGATIGGSVGLVIAIGVVVGAGKGDPSLGRIVTSAQFKNRSDTETSPDSNTSGNLSSVHVSSPGDQKFEGKSLRAK
mmetsp:Transcript_34935/g.37837  ORF Transcript_34935/g.37837 Transcript_34935/m.37837 type:complete len:96 (-) Transcript_34935:95-382(-)